MALRVKHVGEYGTHATAKKAGFKKDDIVVGMDGATSRFSEGELIGYLLDKHRPGEQIKVMVLRGAERTEFTLPMQ